MFVSHPAIAGFTGNFPPGAHLAQAFFQASVTLTAFFADQCPFLESINHRIMMIGLDVGYLFHCPIEYQGS